MSKKTSLKLKRFHYESKFQELQALAEVKNTDLAKSVLSLGEALSHVEEEFVNKRELPNTPEILKYKEEIKSIGDKFVQKDENGKVISDQNGNPFIKDREKYHAEMSSLNSRSKEAIDQISVFEKEFQKYAEEEIVVEFENFVTQIPKDFNVTELQAFQNNFPTLSL